MTAPFSFLNPYSITQQVIAQPTMYDFEHTSGNGGLTLGLVLPYRYLNSGGTGTVGFSASTRIYLRPFFVGALGRTVRSMSVNQNGGTVGSTMRLGIYRCAPPAARDIYPTLLMKDFGSTVWSGVSTLLTSPVDPVFLPNGLYYTAFKVTTGGFTLDFTSSASGQVISDMDLILGREMSATSDRRYQAIAAEDASAAAALPATCPAGGVLGFDTAFVGPLVGING